MAKEEYSRYENLKLLRFLGIYVTCIRNIIIKILRGNFFEENKIFLRILTNKKRNIFKYV